MPMPVIINPKNTEKWKEDKAKENKKTPQFTTVKWAKTSAKEGEEVELSANVKDIDDGNMVTLQVFPEGKGPENGFAYAKFPLTLKGGSVSAKWSWHADSRELPPDQDPKFIFSAHSAWCNYKKSSGSLTVKLLRPEITKAEWQDSDGNSASKGLVGDTLKLHAETKDMADGAGVRFCVYDSKTGEKVAEPAAKVNGSKVDAEWTYHYDPSVILKEKPKFYFTADAPRTKQKKSSDVEISAKISVTLQDINGGLYSDIDYVLYKETENCKNGTSDSNGAIEQTDLIPGSYTIELKEKK